MITSGLNNSFSLNSVTLWLKGVYLHFKCLFSPESLKLRSEYLINPITLKPRPLRAAELFQTWLIKLITMKLQVVRKQKGVNIFEAPNRGSWSDRSDEDDGPGEVKKLFDRFEVKIISDQTKLSFPPPSFNELFRCRTNPPTARLRRLPPQRAVVACWTFFVGEKNCKLLHRDQQTCCTGF